MEPPAATSSVQSENFCWKLDWIADVDSFEAIARAVQALRYHLNAMIGTAEEFVELRSSDKPEDYLRAASEAAQIHVWLKVINQYPEMRRWVAQNKTVPAEILNFLAHDLDPAVRLAVAMKNKLSEDLFFLLAQDTHDGVRQRLSYNKNTPRSVLGILARDSNQLVSEPASARLSRLNKKRD